MAAFDWGKFNRTVKKKFGKKGKKSTGKKSGSGRGNAWVQYIKGTKR